MNPRSCVGPHKWLRPAHVETFCSECGEIRKSWMIPSYGNDYESAYAEANVERAAFVADLERMAADPLYVGEPQYATVSDRPGITIPLLLAIVVVVVVALAVWGWTR